jgi:transposase
MRPYREYRPDQGFLVPPSLADLIPTGDPVFMLRDVLAALDLEPFHRVYQKSNKGQPPYHPQVMVGLYLYGAMRRVYSSRRLAELCQRDVACMYLVGRATPDYHTVNEFRQRFTEEIKGLFLQVLLLCQEAGLVRLGHIALDGTKVQANASKHKAMTYERMGPKELALDAEIQQWLEEGMQQDKEEDERYGPDDDGWTMPPEIKETDRRLAKIQAAKARLETMAREKAQEKGKDPAAAVVPPRAQSNFTDPESRIMKTPQGFDQCYNAQNAVDAESQVVVAYEVSNQPDVRRLTPMLKRVHDLLGKYPEQLSADAGYASEANFAVLAEAEVEAVIALRRYHRDEPPDADPAAKGSSGRWPHRNAMRDRLTTAEGKAIYKLRKQTVEPVFGQIKGARGFRQFLRRGLINVEGEWSLLCTTHNLLKLHKAKSRSKPPRDPKPRRELGQPARQSVLI